MDDNLKYIFDYYKSPKHCLVESSEIDNVCHGKMKKNSNTLMNGWSFSHCISPFTRFIYQLMNTEPMVFHIYIYTSCHSHIGFHPPPAYPTRSELFYFPSNCSQSNHSTKLKYFFPIRSYILLTFQQQKNKTREWIWFYHHVRKFFFFFICMYTELKNKNRGRGNDTVFTLNIKKNSNKETTVVSSGWAKNERARAECVCVCVVVVEESS
jgi:hypothetical protein